MTRLVQCKSRLQLQLTNDSRELIALNLMPAVQEFLCCDCHCKAQSLFPHESETQHRLDLHCSISAVTDAARQLIPRQ